MSEEKIISRLSVFIFGAVVFVGGIYHSFPGNMYWLSFILSGSFSFLSGIFLRKNKTPFKIKSLLFMSSILIMFPVFNFYVRKTPFNYCFIYPIVIYIMFLAGHSINFKEKVVKSMGILLISVIFLASSYFYVPYLLFQINSEKANVQINNIELYKLNGEKFTEKDAVNKVILFFYRGSLTKLDNLAKHFKNEKKVLIYYVFEEDEHFHNLETIKDFNIDKRYSFKVLFDKDNKFGKSLKFDKTPAAFIVDKNLKIREIFYNKYFFYGSYYVKRIIKDINLLLKE